MTPNEETHSWSCGASNASLSTQPSIPTKPATLDSIGGRLQLLLEGRQPITNEIPKILLLEQEEWERRFPTLIVNGKHIPLQNYAQQANTNQKDNLKISIARKIVENHLWPQIQTVLGMECTEYPRKTRIDFNSSAQHRKAELSTTEEQLFLPAI